MIAAALKRDIDIGAKENKLQEGSFGSADAKSTDHNDYTLGPLESSDNKENQGSPELGVGPNEVNSPSPTRGQGKVSKDGAFTAADTVKDGLAKKIPLGDATLHTPNADTTSCVTDKEKAAASTPVSWLAADCSALPALLSSLACLLRAPLPAANRASDDGQCVDATTAGSRADLLWYLFATNHASLLAHLLRSAQVLGAETSSDRYFNALITAACDLLVSCGWYLRVDSGLARFPGDDPVEYVAQLSMDVAKKSKHPQAKSIRSLLRINEVPVSLLALLDSVLSAAVMRSQHDCTSCDQERFGRIHCGRGGQRPERSPQQKKCQKVSPIIPCPCPCPCPCPYGAGTP